MCRTKFLYKNENIFYSGSVLKRKGLFSKKRYLILTDKPRLLYIDENKMKEKGEIPWSDHMSLELKDERQFLIRIVRPYSSPKHSFHLPVAETNVCLGRFEWKCSTMD